MHRSRLLLEQVLENQRAPGLAPSLHQRAALFELAEVHGRETESLGKVRDPRCGSCVVARQEHDAVAALHVWVGGKGAWMPVIETLNEPGARDGLGGERRVRRSEDRSVGQ